MQDGWNPIDYVLQYSLKIEKDKIMSGLYSRYWVVVAIVFSVIFVIFGFPTFQCKFGFPALLLWSFCLACNVALIGRYICFKSLMKKTQHS